MYYTPMYIYIILIIKNVVFHCQVPLVTKQCSTFLQHWSLLFFTALSTPNATNISIVMQLYVLYHMVHFLTTCRTWLLSSHPYAKNSFAQFFSPHLKTYSSMCSQFPPLSLSATGWIWCNDSGNDGTNNGHVLYNSKKKQSIYLNFYKMSLRISYIDQTEFTSFGQSDLLNKTYITGWKYCTMVGFITAPPLP
jgi:hypothetical protein